MRRDRELSEGEREKGKELANTVTSALNNFSFEAVIKAAVEELANSHRTLQQCFTQLCFEWLRHMARQEQRGCFDLRNEQSCKLAAKVVAVIGPDGALPFI